VRWFLIVVFVGVLSPLAGAEHPPKENVSLSWGAWIGGDCPSEAQSVPASGWLIEGNPDKLVKDLKTTVLPPIQPGEELTCAQQPDLAEVLRALPRIEFIPYVYEVYRNDLEYTAEKLVDRVDAPRFFPLVGSAQIHHCHWKCTVHYTEVVESSYPIAFRYTQQKSVVVYIDRDHLHLLEKNADR
jgi:hypothetical protein